MGEAIAFYTLAAGILVLAVMVITARSAVHSVVYLVMNFLLVAVLYVTLSAPFLAVIQVLVYAGGIVVLYLFVLMLVSLKRPAEAHSDPKRRSRLGLGLVVAVLAQVVAIMIYSSSRPAPGVDAATQHLAARNVEQVGWVLYTDYLIPFELASVLLLVAMVGAIVLARRDV
jgi:NADH-quinone oxidoreductase subunit J